MSDWQELHIISERLGIDISNIGWTWDDDAADEDDARLITLSFISTRLAELPAGIFDELTSLEELRLGHNRLTELPAGIFDELTSLRLLYLHDNRLPRLPIGIFDELTSLEQLYLYHNRITELPAGIFDQSRFLEQLILNNNYLTELPQGIFDHLGKLRKLGIVDNRLTELSPGLFDRLTSLSRLQFSVNRLIELPSGIFGRLRSLSLLNFSYCQITKLSKGIFDELTSLEELRLGHNQLTTLPAGIFLKLTSMHSLSLVGNRINVPFGIENNLKIIENKSKIIELSLFINNYWKKLEIQKKMRLKQKETILISKFNELAKLPYPGKTGEVPHIDLAQEWGVTNHEADKIMKQFIREGKIQIIKKLGQETRDDYSDDVWIVNEQKSSQVQNENVDIKDLGQRVLKIISQVKVDIPMSLIRLSELALSEKNYVEIILMSMIDQQPDLGTYLPLEQVFIKKSEVNERTLSQSTIADSLQKCKNCGDTQSILIRTCTNCGKTLPHCNICKRGFVEKDQTTSCPECDNPFHRTHLIAQVQSGGSCPVCREPLTLAQIS